MPTDYPFPRPPVGPAERTPLFHRWGIVETDEAPWRMKAPALRHHFGCRSGSLIVTRLVRNTLWRLRAEIQAGTERGIGGNVRTLWYRYLKPTVARGGHPDPGATYQTTMQQLNRMVFDLRLFDYGDFDFTDLFWESRRIGKDRPEVIVCSEKLSLVRFLRAVHARHSVTTVAWSGQPPGVTVENTARHALTALRAAGRTTQPFRIIALVDYDPGGAAIAGEIQRSLQQLGFDTTLHLPIHPRELTQREVGIRKIPIVRRHRVVEHGQHGQRGHSDRGLRLV